MNLRHVASCGLACAALALTGCDQGREEPGQVTVRVVHVAPGFQDLDFRREQRDNVLSLSFGGLQEATYDVDTYDFFVFERVAVGAPRSWTFNRQLQADRAYTFVLTDVAGDVQPLVLENEAAPASDAQIQALHGAAGHPALDLYLERPGVGIAGATPRGTFGPHEQIAARTIASGEYELFLTAAGNPADVRMASGAFVLPAGVTSTLIVMPATGEPPRPTVMLVQPTSTVLFDRNVASELRVINAATDMVPRDFVLNGQFTPPLFSAIPFAEPTAFAPMPVGQQTVNVTPVGNPGVLELSQPIGGFAAQRSTLLFTGPAGTLTHTFVTDDGRRLYNAAKLVLMNAATQFPTVEFVLTPVGGNPADHLAFVTLAAPGASPLGYDQLPPADYDLYLRQPGTANLLSGPTRLSLTNGGIYGVLATNGADTATAAVTLFDDFP